MIRVALERTQRVEVLLRFTLRFFGALFVRLRQGKLVIELFGYILEFAFQLLTPSNLRGNLISS
jgi:hypothetical protein